MRLLVINPNTTELTGSEPLLEALRGRIPAPSALR